MVGAAESDGHGGGLAINRAFEASDLAGLVAGSGVAPGGPAAISTSGARAVCRVAGRHDRRNTDDRPAMVHLMTQLAPSSGTVERKRRGQGDIGSMRNW
jgi:hypothetical protein